MFVKIVQVLPVQFSQTSGLRARTSSAVSKVSDRRYMSDYRSRGSEFDPGPVPYFRGD